MLIASLNAIAETYNYPVIVSTHPRTRNKINEKGFKFHEKVSLMKPMGFHDYINLQKNSKVVISDSGTISEESSILGFSAINIRDAHERPEAMEEASVMMVGMNKDRIMQAITILESDNRETSYRSVADYSMPNVSHKVERIILSYTDYINRVVWSKHISNG